MTKLKMQNKKHLFVRVFLSLMERLGGGLLVALGFVITLATVFAFQSLSSAPADSGFQSAEAPIFSDGNAGNGVFSQATDSLEAISNKLSDLIN